MSTIDTYRTGPHFQARSAQATRRASSLLAMLAWIEAMLERRRSRFALAEMTDEQLKDIGISRYDAYREAHRPFWN